MQAINTQGPNQLNFDKLNLRNDDMEQDQSDKTSSSSHMQQDEEIKDIDTEIEEVMGAQEYDEEIKEEEVKDIEVAISEVMGEEETKEEVKEPESPQILPCQKRHRCGHVCDGVAGEQVCPPCLEDECSIHSGAAHQLPLRDNLCSICYTSELCEEPIVQLSCGHIFHANCVKMLMKHRWSTLRISFEFMACPECKHPIDQVSHCEPIQFEIEKINELKIQVQEMAVKISQKPELVDLDPVSDPQSEWYNKPQEFVMAKCAFYQCHECSKPFYGGQIDCGRDLNTAETMSKEDLICKDCNIKQIGGGNATCAIHGSQYIAWKCYMCCREALYLCSGTMYLCEYHHRGDVWYNPKTKVEDCGGVNCPLGVNHPPASKDPMKSNYPLGCSLCRKTEKLGKDAKPAIQAIEIEETKRTDLANFSEQQ